MRQEMGKFTFRVPISMLRRAKLKRLPLSMICRKSIYQALADSEVFLENAAPLRSKTRSVQLWNKMSAHCVRTLPVENWEKIAESPFKLEMFRQFFLPKCPNKALAYLGEFLDGGEYSESVLETFLSGNDLIEKETLDTVLPECPKHPRWGDKDTGTIIPFPENTIGGCKSLESSKPLRP